MKDRYYIMDVKRNRFYQGDKWAYDSWLSNAFVKEIDYAVTYESKEKAMDAIARFLKDKTEFDGNTPLAKDRLVVVKMNLVIV